MSIKTIQHDLPSLKAKITGELDDAAGLALFRGIPYASVKKRWTHSRTMNLLDPTFDATNFGPRCVQGDGPVMVSGGTNDATPGDDEFKCLNLNITVPSDVLLDPGYRKTTGLLPVMFWIHGGAFNYGANSVGRYRPQRLSQLAKQGATPIVLVQINYRIGPLGFVASNDLASEQSITPSETSTLGNYGFVDQRNALQWVQDHIHDFGGDPTNVTAFGVSAGSASIHYHILTGSPLFDRAILMSGSAPTLGPLPFKLYEEAWKDLCQKCGVKEEATAQRLEILRAMKPMDIVRNYPTAAMGPLGDGVLLPKTWSLFEEPSPTRCKAIILGDTGVEGIVVDGVSLNVSQERFRHHVKSIFSAPDAEAFCKIFGFTSENVSYENYRDAMRLFLGLIMFQYPNLMIAEHFSNPRSAYLYHFEEPSPYEGPTFGIPYHGQCALYMYQNENEAYSESGQRTAVEMGRIWTAFAHGKQPWEPYDKDRRFYRFGPDGTNAMFDVKTDNSRKYGYLEWLRDHFEGAKELAQGLLQGYMT